MPLVFKSTATVAITNSFPNAKIFDVATTQPNFRHSYSSFLFLILKLDCSKHFFLINDLLIRLNSDQYQ
ncbi:hypothetical protein J1N35_000824, partial [Gossypium stocksii]